MHIKELSTRVVTFNLAAALEQYEMDLRQLAHRWLDPDLFRRLQEEFKETRLLAASLPKLAVSWTAVLISRTRLVQALCSRTALALSVLQEHLAAVEGLKKRCLRTIGAQSAALT
jgi:hypothetical protein